MLEDGTIYPPLDDPYAISNGMTTTGIDIILSENPRKNANAQGGLISLMNGGYLSGSTDGIASLNNGYAAGGNIVGRYLSGATDGMADKIPASIDGSQRAALSDGEFVLPADVVSHFGNGNSDAGANALYNMMAKVRKDRTGNASQGNQINPSSYLPS